MIAQPLWSRVNKTDTCWEWIGGKFQTGYGRYWQNGKGILAHRFIYEMLVGPIPKDKQLDHLCRNRGCVNPSHLEPVTLRENILRGEGSAARNARKTHCRRGHVLNGENVKINANGSRVCQTCRRKYDREYKMAERRVLGIPARRFTNGRFKIGTR